MASHVAATCWFSEPLAEFDGLWTSTHDRYIHVNTHERIFLYWMILNGGILNGVDKPTNIIGGPPACRHVNAGLPIGRVITLRRRLPVMVDKIMNREQFRFWLVNVGDILPMLLAYSDTMFCPLWICEVKTVTSNLWFICSATVRIGGHKWIRHELSCLWLQLWTLLSPKMNAHNI